jgi:hypothetical protein
MRRGIKTDIFITLGALMGVFFSSLFFSSSAFAVSPILEGAQYARSSSQPANLFGMTGVFTIISNTLLFIVGALAVLMLIVGGLRYVLSGGNQTSVTAAKNTVLYAIVGLIVSILAYAVINFVLSSLIGGGSSY